MPDPGMNWIRKRKYWTLGELGSLIAVVHTADEAFDEGKIICSPRSEEISQFEVSDYGITAVQIAAADDDDGQLVYGYHRCPIDLDPGHPVGFRINWTQSAAVTVGVTFKLEIGTDAKDAALKAEDGLSVLDTLIAESNAGGAWYNQWTSRGVKNAIGLTRTQIEDGALLRFGFEADVIDGTIVNCCILGLEMDYMPMRCQGYGNDVDGPLQSDGVA